MAEEEPDYAFPFIERISEMGIRNIYKNQNCQQRLFCDMANYGSKRYATDKDEVTSPNMVQKVFNTVAQT
jgi:hypothetical protein